MWSCRLRDLTNLLIYFCGTSFIYANPNIRVVEATFGTWQYASCPLFTVISVAP